MDDGWMMDAVRSLFSACFPRQRTNSLRARVAGCQQTVVSEYTHTSLSEGQQSSLVEAFGSLEKRQHNGVSVGSVLLVNEERVAGMARSGPTSFRSTCVLCFFHLTAMMMCFVSI